MQKNKKMRGSELGNGFDVNKWAGDDNNRQNVYKTPVIPKGAKIFAPRSKRRSLRSENDVSHVQGIYSKSKSCVICGNSDEVVDLSDNPIMKKTMASYCEGDGVNLDECLSSLCITCVFKSRAVKEVQNNIKARLYELSNGLKLKTTEKNEFNYDIEEYSEGIETAEANIVLKNTIEYDDVKKLKVFKRTNGVSASFEGSPEPTAIIETGETRRRLTTSSVRASFDASDSYNHPSCNSLKRYLDKNGTFNSSADDMDNKNTLKLTNYKLTETSHVQMEAGYNADVQTSLSCQEMELMAITMPSSKPSSRSNSTLSQNGVNHSMLQVIREQSESVLITESGGKINNYKRTLRPQAQRQCRYCGISYIRKDHFSKHLRRCRNINSRRVSSLAITAEENKEIGNTKRIRVDDENNCIMPSNFQTSKQIRKFHCTECVATLDSIAQLRKHRETHLREYNCEMCGKKFHSLHEHDFHRIVCLAERQVWQERQLEEQEEQQPNDKRSVVRSVRSVKTSMTNRRVTRAQSKAQSVARQRATVRRRLTVLTSVSQYMYDHTDDESSVTDYRYTGNDEDDDVSVADSMDSRRRVYTDDWLEMRNSNENFDLPALQIESGKEYDLYLLERLKAQIKAQEFTCLVEDCDFFTDTLLNLMLHDYVHHFKSSWFYCQKCSSVFTSKVFLDYHLDRQNGGRFICYKCSEQFMFQHQLDMHLIAHTKQTKHLCDKCKCEFLTEGKLSQHVRLEHNSDIEKKMICVQSKTTFASSRSLDENWYVNGKQHRKYVVTILNMRLPRMPSKRPLELPGHKPYRRRIGGIEFENERNPNCCSCK